MTQLTARIVDYVARNSRSWRRQTCFSLPALIVAALLIDKLHGNVVERALTAAILGVMLQVVGTFAYGVIQTGVVCLLGEPIDYDVVFEPRNYIGGLILAVAVWTLWQHDRDRTVDAIASCVSHQSYEARWVGLRGLVMQCYEATRASDDDLGE